MKYNIGDKVKIKNDLVIGGEYDGFEFTEEMAKALGRELTIKFVDCPDSKCDGWYFMKEDDIADYDCIAWTDSMIECKVEEV